MSRCSKMQISVVDLCHPVTHFLTMRNSGTLPALHAFANLRQRKSLDFAFRGLPLGNPALANRIDTTTVILWYLVICTIHCSRIPVTRVPILMLTLLLGKHCDFELWFAFSVTGSKNSTERCCTLNDKNQISSVIRPPEDNPMTLSYWR